MLYMKPQKEALAIHERAVKKYNASYQNMERLGNQLYNTRVNSVELIHKIELLVNSIANRPKEYDKRISDIRTARERFNETEKYAEDAMKSVMQSGVGVAAGVAAGVAVASMAPTAAMWVATTFGTASTGTAISALHGAVATNAALAWLGGGALSAGGAGMAGGQAFLALAGPIGWGITAGATVVSVASLGCKNKKIADEAINEAKKITMAGAKLNEAGAKIQNLTDETAKLMNFLQASLTTNQSMKNRNYLELNENEQYRLGTMVNNTLSLAELLNKTI